uniref:Uncharacterized protein n=1 Tax=Oryzias sinensis TaxID=183150 RepID=A0A8C7WRX3_9TELE
GSVRNRLCVLRWLDYTAVGRRLQGTRFIAFKVPLKQALTRMLPRSSVFGPWELLDAVSRDRQELGLIIDLTFTSRYYDLQDLPASLMFVKIFTAGHQVPSDGTILSFKRAVNNFLRDNQDNGDQPKSGLTFSGTLCLHRFSSSLGSEQFYFKTGSEVSRYTRSRSEWIQNGSELDPVRAGGYSRKQVMLAPTVSLRLRKLITSAFGS